MASMSDVKTNSWSCISRDCRTNLADIIHTCAHGVWPFVVSPKTGAPENLDDPAERDEGLPPLGGIMP